MLLISLGVVSEEASWSICLNKIQSLMTQYPECPGFSRKSPYLEVGRSQTEWGKKINICQQQDDRDVKIIWQRFFLGNHHKNASANNFRSMLETWKIDSAKELQDKKKNKIEILELMSVTTNLEQWLESTAEWRGQREETVNWMVEQ